MRNIWQCFLILTTSCFQAHPISDDDSAEPCNCAPPPPGCETVSLESVESLEANTSTGFGAAQILEFVEGRRTESIYWFDPSQEVEPEQGLHQLSLTVSYQGDPIEVIKREPEYSEQYPMVLDCPDQMTIPVQVSLETDGGALKETFKTGLEVKSHLFASINKTLDLDSLVGDLSVAPSRPNCEFSPQISIYSSFTPYGISGSVGFLLECHLDNNVMSISSFSADWPSEDRYDYLTNKSRCGTFQQEVELDSALGNFSPADAIALVNSTQGLNLTSQDGTRTAVRLSFEAETDHACLILITPEQPGDTDPAPAGSCRIPGVLTLGNPDNAFQARYDSVGFFARPDLQGRLALVTVSFRVPATDTNKLFSKEVNRDSHEMLTSINFAPAEEGSQVSGELKPMLIPLPNDDQTQQQELATYIWSN